LYSGAIPGLIGLLPFYFFTNFWVDKYLMLRHYRVPPNYGIRLSDRVTNYLAICLILRGGLNLWLFTTQEIFPSHLYYEYFDGLPYAYINEAEDIWEDRLRSKFGFLYFLLLCGIVALFLFFQPCFKELMVACFFKTKRRKGGEKVWRPYSLESRQIEKDRGLANYDLESNKEYKGAYLGVKGLQRGGRDDF